MTSLPEAGALEAQPTPAKPKRRWWLIAMLALFAVIAGVGIPLAIHWRDSPMLFQSAGNASGYPKPVIGHTYVFNTFVEAKTTKAIDVRSITPRISMNTAKATVELVQCRRRPGAVMSDGGTIADFATGCLSITPFRPGRYQMIFGSAVQFAVEITPHQAGSVHIDGFRVRYNDGFRRGDQVSGVYIYTGEPQSFLTGGS